MPEPSHAQLADLTGVIMDCDGVVTPGDLIYDEDGKRTLRFNVRDGLAIALMCRNGLKVGVLSGRPCDVAERRMRELGVQSFVGKCHDKRQGVVAMCRDLGILPEQCAYIGDDLPDLGAFTQVGISIAVADAAQEVRDAAHWVTRTAGGRGAVREVGEAILKARGDWQRYLIKQKSGAA